MLSCEARQPGWGGALEWEHHGETKQIGESREGPGVACRGYFLPGSGSGLGGEDRRWCEPVVKREGRGREAPFFHGWVGSLGPGD